MRYREFTRPFRLSIALALVLGCGTGCASVFDNKVPSPVVRSDSSRASIDTAPFQVTPSSTDVAAKQDLSDYRLGGGDVITVRVFGEDDLSREKIRLTDRGTVSIPALGELTIKGLTLGDVERLVTRGLKGRILVNPKVSVFVDEYRPFFINGMVSRPGGYPFQPGLTLRAAASLAGGFKDRASFNKLFVLRAGDVDQKQIKVNLDTPIYPGDIITVEESFF